jgi:hypothetical protein
MFLPEQNPEIKINIELSHIILDVDLRNVPWSLFSIFQIKKEQIV